LFFARTAAHVGDSGGAASLLVTLPASSEGARTEGVAVVAIGIDVAASGPDDAMGGFLRQATEAAQSTAMRATR